jgi:hypothetical protein
MERVPRRVQLGWLVCLFGVHGADSEHDRGGAHFPWSEVVSIHFTKNHIRATGKDANGLFIAMAHDAQLIKWAEDKTGDSEFQKMVCEAIAARGIVSTSKETSR